MSFLKLFAGASPEKLELQGDAFFETGHWGEAKLEYERAFDKLQKRSGRRENRQKQLEAKILKTREALAKEHHRNGRDLIDAGCFDEARELLALAMEITTDESFKQALEQQLQEVPANTDAIQPDFFYGLENDEEEEEAFENNSDEEYFFALCNTLPDEVKDAYQAYGHAFQTGYSALNRGDFQTAASSLSRALEENPRPGSYIPLELATAYVHLGKQATAQELLEDFLKHHPETLPAYQILCEIYWEQKEFHRADELLASVPEEYSTSIAFFILRGQTLYHSEQYEAAGDYYQQFLDTYGWNETVARELAKVYEALGKRKNARRLYKEIIDRCKNCQTCGTQVDPAVKHRYAELCFDEGMAGADLLELYLFLARELPDNASLYFDRISRIYEKQGNVAEAQRFRTFSQQSQIKK